MTEAPPPDALHWIRDRRAYMRLKRRESRLRETAESREARLESMRQYRRLHVDHTSLERGKRYFEDSKGRSVKAAWRRANAHRYRAHAAKRHQNAHERVHNAISASIWTALKTRKAGRKWEALVGYTLADLVRHLERQFSAEMSWSNYGGVWHIDHIVPRAYLRSLGWTDETVKAAWALSNLRPLPRLDNIRKGAKRLYLI